MSASLRGRLVEGVEDFVMPNANPSGVRQCSNYVRWVRWAMGVRVMDVEMLASCIVDT